MFPVCHYTYREQERRKQTDRRHTVMNTTDTIDLTDIDLDPFDDAN